MTTLKTPAGRPASSKTRASATTEAGVSVAGLMTIVLPAISAAIDFHAGIAIGKFHGVTNAQTPTGCRTHIANLFGSSDGRREAEEPPPLARGEERHVDRFLDVAARLGEDLAHLARHEPRELLLVALQDLAGGVEDLGAPRRRRVRASPGRPSSPPRRRRRRPAGRSSGTGRRASSLSAGLRFSNVCPEAAGTHLPPMKLCCVSTAISVAISCSSAFFWTGPGGASGADIATLPWS